MRYFRVIATLAVVVACTVRCGAETTIPARLSVTDAVQLAMQANPDLKSSRDSKLTAESDLRVAGFRTSLNFGSSAKFDRKVVPASTNSDGSANPSFIDANLSSLLKSSYSYESFAGTQATAGFTPLGLGRNSTGFDLTIRQPLLKGRGLLSSKGLAYKSAQSSLVVTDKREFLSEQSTIQGVVEAYYDAVMAREEVKVREQAVHNAEIAADGWRKREAAGIAAGIDVTRSEVQVAQTKNQLNAQQRTERNALDKLMIAIGGGVGQTPELVDSVPTTEITLPPLGDAVKKALANRVELDISDERVAEQLRQLSAAKDAMKPQLDLTAGLNGASDSNSLASRSLIDYGLFYTGIEYSIPLDQRVTREKRQNVARELDLLNTQKDFQMEQITEEVRAAYRRVESTKASLDILAQNKISAENNLRIANRMMEVGRGSSRDVLDAQLAVTEVDSSILSAKTDYFLAAIDLKRAMGEDISTMEFK